MISPINFLTANLALFAGLTSAMPTFISSPVTQGLEPVNGTLVTRGCTYTGQKAHIMAAGDTLAVGWTSSGKNPDWWGYRQELIKLMGTEAPISYVGTEHHGSGHNLQTFQGYFEKGIADIKPGVMAALPSTNPDAIILTAGTNDVFNSRNSKNYLNVPGMMDTFLAEIFAWNPNVIVVLSGLPLINSGSYQGKANQVSDGYNSLVGKYTQAGRRILYADVTGALTTDDLVGPSTPNTAGYKKLAAVYARSLQTAVCNGWFNK